MALNPDCPECKSALDALKGHEDAVFIALKCDTCGAQTKNWGKPGFVDNPPERVSET